MSDQTAQEGELILYRTAGDAVRVEVLYESESVWLDQRRMAELFGVDFRSASYDLKEVYATGGAHAGGNSPKNLESSTRGISSESELEERAVIRNFRITAAEAEGAVLRNPLIAAAGRING